MKIENTLSESSTRITENGKKVDSLAAGINGRMLLIDNKDSEFRFIRHVRRPAKNVPDMWIAC